jgi:hypothetical protein
MKIHLFSNINVQNIHFATIKHAKFFDLKIETN